MATAYQSGRRVLVTAAFVIGLTVASWSSTPAIAQIVTQSRAVGGVHIDAQGIVNNLVVDDQRELQLARQKALQPISNDLNERTELRKVSLRKLDLALAELRESGTPLPDAIKYLAGLQRIQYIFVYPEQQDIVLAGPAEGWKVDAKGEVVGATTGHPVLLLDDLLVALRASETSASGISCSIDPTPEGLQRLRKTVARMKTIGNPRTTFRKIEQSLGPQVVTVSGVPGTSRLAQVLVAADFRMKRLAMGFEESPVRGMPSYLELAEAGSRGMQNMLPRWWLDAAYAPLVSDSDGLSWEIRGPGVKCMTEEDFLQQDGSRQQGARRANMAAKKWAETMTDKYDELAQHDSVFGQLRNIMDLAVVAALIQKEDLLGRAGASLSDLMEDQSVADYHQPKVVATQASFVKKGSNWMISASGGVQFYPWQIAEKKETSTDLAPLRDQATEANDSWWWN